MSASFELTGDKRRRLYRKTTQGVVVKVGAYSPSQSDVVCLPRGLYDTLGVAREATAREIDVAFKCRALWAHPDKPSGSREQWNVLYAAFAVLSDVGKRNAYDLGLLANGSRDGTETIFLSLGPCPWSHAITPTSPV